MPCILSAHLQDQGRVQRTRLEVLGTKPGYGWPHFSPHSVGPTLLQRGLGNTLFLCVHEEKGVGFAEHLVFFSVMQHMGEHKLLCHSYILYAIFLCLFKKCWRFTASICWNSFEEWKLSFVFCFLVCQGKWTIIFLHLAVYFNRVFSKNQKSSVSEMTWFKIKIDTETHFSPSVNFLHSGFCLP